MSCTVRGCRNVWYPGSSVKYHSFPVDPSRRSAWLAEIQVKGLFYNSARICSDHFKLEDYDPERPGKLLKHAVPNYAYKSCECCNSLECPNMPSTSQHKSTTVSNLEHTLPPKINTSDDENKAPILRRLLDVYRENADAKASPVTSAALLPVAGCSVAILHSPTQHITKKDGESPRKRSVLKDINIQTNMRTSREKTLMKENKILKQRVKRQGNKINDMKSIIHVMRSQLEIENILKVGSQPKPALAKLRNILNSSRFCTICYETGDLLTELDEYPFIEEMDNNGLNLQEILEDVFRDADSKIVISPYICEDCKHKLLQSYTFIHNTQRNVSIFDSYLTQLDSETLDLLNCMKENISCANAIIVLDEHKANNIEPEKYKWKNTTNNTPKSTRPAPVGQTVTRQLILKNYVCECCQKEFCDKKFLIAHLKARTGLCGKEQIVSRQCARPMKAKVMCPSCKKNPCEHARFINDFIEQKELKHRQIKCLECEFTTNTLTSMISHINKKHSEALVDNCELCGKMFHLTEQYYSHFETFHKEYKLCIHCNCVFPFTDIRSHEIECVNTDKPYFCNKCPARLESELQATVHEMRHEDMPKKPKNKRIVLKRCYTCPLCPLKFDGKIKLQKHVSVTHCNESYKNNWCQFCDIKFVTRQDYLAHMKATEHMADIDPSHRYKYKCEYCDYTARHSFILKTHMNRYHLKIMPFECDVCNKRFLDKRKLKAHIDRHMGKSKRVCDICGDTLGSTTALVKHKRLHTGERPYPCHLCDVSLNSASERKFHVLRKHTEKSHPCPLCDTKFHTPYFVRRHIQQVHWKRKEKFDHTKIEGLHPKHYELFRDKRMVVL